jgi:hypothetical protein
MKPIPDRHYPIPVAINLLAVAVCSVLYFLLLYAASHVANIEVLIICGCLFAALMIPVYDP